MKRRMLFDRLGFGFDVIPTPVPFGVHIAAFSGGSGSGGDSGGSDGNGDGAQGNTGGDAGTQNGAAGSTGGDSGTGSEGSQQQPKTFTQEQVTAMMTREKEQGRQAALKELGIVDPTQAKAILEAAGKLSDATKPADQKLDEKDQAIAAANAKAEAAEQKLELALSKAKSDHLDDVLLLAKARVTDKVDFKAAVALVKAAMPQFFEGDDAGSTGTGDPPGGKKGDKKSAGKYGERAAAISKPPANAAGPDTFFKN